MSFFLPGLLAGLLLGSLGVWLAQRGRKVAPVPGQDPARLEPALLRAEVSAALTRPASVRALLQPCAEAMVRHLDAAFARIWVLPPGADVLELQASAGLYTHLDGPHSRVPVGQLKIGLIARERRPHLTQDVVADPRVPDKDWARRERMVAFAGYPLIAEGQVVGVMALFARQQLAADTLETLASVADAVAQGIARKRAEDELQQAIRARDDFLAIASHELRTPLTPLRLGVQRLQKLLQSPGYSEAELRDRLATVDRQAVRITRLVESLLDLSRLQRGMLQLQCERCDLAALVRDVLERSREVLKQAGCDASLDAPAPVWVHADRLRMEQVVENLLSNAMKYGAGQPVAMRCGTEEGLAQLAVQDGGIGIAPEDQLRIFERFERASSVRHYGGFGLGLFILREIIEAHGGKVSVKSHPGDGATFTVVLPLAPEQAAVG